MKKVYQVKVALVIDDEHRQAIMDQAKRYYTESGGASTVDNDGTMHPITPDEAVQSVGDALMELIQSHPAFDGEAVAVAEMSCDSEEIARPYEERVDEGEHESASAHRGGRDRAP